MYAILHQGEVVFISDMEIWAMWFETADRQIARTQVGDVLISTVFLGIDHSFGRGEPLFFETMAFGGKWEGEETRSSTIDDALEHHERMVERVRNDR